MEQAQAGALLRPMRPESLMRGHSALGAGEAQETEKTSGVGVRQVEGHDDKVPMTMHRLAGLAPFAPKVAGRSGAAAQVGGEAARAQLPTQTPPSSLPSFTSPLACDIEIPLPLSPLPDALMPAYQAALIPPQTDAQAPASAESAMPDPLAGLELLAPDLLDEPEDDWPDENEQDAIPTAQMPLPACVPLFDMTDAPRGRRKGPWVVGGIGAALALGGALAWYLWRHSMLP